MLKKQKGFTIVELLVVVLVIGILSGVLIGVLNSSGTRAKARDGQRKADLKRIQIALELYYADKREYPDTGSLNSLAPDYISSLPVDPLGRSGDNGCASGARGYFYTSTKSTYTIQTVMEVASSNDDGKCASCSSNDYCYEVRNP